MKLHVVLVRSEYPANIGSVARAMANMGADQLFLIDPQCRISVRAKEMAAGAQEKLAAKKIFKSWEDFYALEGQGIRLALTRRAGRQRKVFALTEKLAELRCTSTSPIYLIFGPEADGLNAADLAWVNHAVHLPTHGEFSSLNLAQAVLLALHLVRDQFPPDHSSSPIKGLQVPSASDFYFPDQLIKEWLTAMGFDVNARRASAYLTLRRLFLQNYPTEHEIHVLESILQQNIRKLKSLRSIDLAAKDLTDHGGNVAGKNI